MPTDLTGAGYPAWVEAVAARFHQAYEAQANRFGYLTRTESAVPWEDVPEANKALMRATVVATLRQVGWRDWNQEGALVGACEDERDADPIFEVIGDVRCPDCDGRGLDSSGANECQLCGGNKFVTIGDTVYDNNGKPEAYIAEDGKKRRWA